MIGRGNSSRDGTTNGYYSTVLLKQNQPQLISTNEPASAKHSSSKNILANFEAAGNRVGSSSVKHSEGGNFFAHQPKVMGRATNMDFLSGFSNSIAAAHQNGNQNKPSQATTTTTNNMLSTNGSTSAMHLVNKREMSANANSHNPRQPNQQPILQDFSSPFMNSAVPSSRTGNQVNSSKQNLSNQQMYRIEASSPPSSMKEPTRHSPNVINGLLQLQNQQQQFEKKQGIKVNNFFYENTEKKKEEQSFQNKGIDKSSARQALASGSDAQDNSSKNGFHTGKNAQQQQQQDRYQVGNSDLSQGTSYLVQQQREIPSSYAYQHLQQMQNNQGSNGGGVNAKNQFYRPPSSERNWRNSTLKQMTTSQVALQLKKKQQADTLASSYEPVQKLSSSSANIFTNSQPGGGTKLTTSPRAPSSPPSLEPQINSAASYITKLNRGDDILGQALKKAAREESANRKRENQGETLDNSTTISSKGKPGTNSLRNSSLLTQSNSGSAQVRSSSAQKDGNKGGKSPALTKPFNLTLSQSSSQSNWANPQLKQSSTTKEQKNFHFFENSEMLNQKQRKQENQTSSALNVSPPSNRFNPITTSANNGINNNQQQNNTQRMQNNLNPEQQSATKLQIENATQAQALANESSYKQLIPAHQEYYMPGIQKCYKVPLPTDYFSQIYREHFLQTFQGIQYSTVARPQNPHDPISKRVFLKSKQQGKKTIIFDLDETLIHCNENSSIPSDVVLTIRFPHGEILEAGINVRPFAVELLRELSSEFEIVVFTASHSSYAKAVLDYLDPQKKYIHHRFFRDHCVQTPQGVYIKDLRIFADRNFSEMVLVDNAAYSFAFQLDNGIPIIPFYENKSDVELRALLPYLRSLKDVKDVREVNRQAFKFSLYHSSDNVQKVYEKLFASSQPQPPSTSPMKASPLSKSSAQSTQNLTKQGLTNFLSNKNSQSGVFSPKSTVSTTTYGKPFKNT